MDSAPLCSNNYSSPVWGNYKVNMFEIFVFAALISFPSWKLFIAILHSHYDKILFQRSNRFLVVFYSCVFGCYILFNDRSKKIFFKNIIYK